MNIFHTVDEPTDDEAIVNQEAEQLGGQAGEILTLVLSNDPILFKKLDNFDFSNPPIDPVYLANSLILTMNKHNGIGLSANQCGLPYRVFVMRTNPTLVCFNPKLVDISSEEIGLEEGCLSYPFLYVKIKRPNIIKVRYTDALGNTCTNKFIGITARCFQHELDHLEGINYLKRANPVLVERAKRDSLKIAKRLKSAKP